MKTKVIKQTITIKCETHEVYETLMNSQKHSRLINAPAKISRRPGGKFSVWDGYASGINLEVVPDHKIVQTWRASDWPEDASSIVTFEFFKARNGTRLVFLQTGVPAAHCESISRGWIEFYWNPLKEMLEK